MKKITNTNYRLFSFLAILILGGACKKAENFYNHLDGQPEVRTNYNTVYGVGDTLTLVGRLHSDRNLEIRVGNVKANILSITREAVQREVIFIDTIEIAKMIITEEMGIGPERSIEVISDGKTVSPPSIQIVEGIESGVLARPVQLVKHVNSIFGATPLFCQNGKGSIYLYQLDGKVVKIDRSGRSLTLFDGAELKDENGLFSISKFNAGGVDSQEQNLYFSAVTTDGSADNLGNNIYRFCRYNLIEKKLTTLNRSVLPNALDQHTLATYTPFEGALSECKLFDVSGVFPDNKGQVFCHIEGSSSFVRINAKGDVKYLIRAGSKTPVIVNSATGSNYSPEEVRRLLPGVLLYAQNTTIRGISPDQALLYLQTGRFSYSIQQIDLQNSVEIYSLVPKEPAETAHGLALYISGTFDILTGGTGRNRPPTLFGYMPLPDSKVLILYHQNLDNQSFPAFGTLNFGEQVGRRYAPGKINRNGFVLGTTDKMLNYDEEGMIYMTANDNMTIIKTTY